MHDIPPLEALGPRIMICGPSNSGKSTLAHAIGKKLDVPAIHLDRLYHLPFTNWEPRPREEFFALHDEAIAGDSWAIEGNYFAKITERMSRATGIIVLGSEPWLGAARNVRRTLFEKNRVGQLDGNKDSIKLDFFRFILFEQPKKRERDLAILRGAGLPMVEPNSMRELRSLYRAWDLKRQAGPG